MQFRNYLETLVLYSVLWFYDIWYTEHGLLNDKSLNARSLWLIRNKSLAQLTYFPPVYSLPCPRINIVKENSLKCWNFGASYLKCPLKTFCLPASRPQRISCFTCSAFDFIYNSPFIVFLKTMHGGSLALSWLLFWLQSDYISTLSKGVE